MENPVEKMESTQNEYESFLRFLYNSQYRDHEEKLLYSSIMEYLSKKEEYAYLLYKNIVNNYYDDESEHSSINSQQTTTEYRFRKKEDQLSKTSVSTSPITDEVFLAECSRIKAMINSSYFESGVFNDVDYYFKRLVNKYGSLERPLSILSYMTNHNIDNEHILEGVLHILSNYDYEDINPFGISIALAATVNHSPVVQDLLISCFESWDSPDGIDILEKMNLEVPWLKRYRDEIVIQLKNNNQIA